MTHEKPGPPFEAKQRRADTETMQCPVQNKQKPLIFAPFHTSEELRLNQFSQSHSLWCSLKVLIGLPAEGACAYVTQTTQWRVLGRDTSTMWARWANPNGSHEWLWIMCNWLPISAWAPFLLLCIQYLKKQTNKNFIFPATKQACYLFFKCFKHIFNSVLNYPSDLILKYLDCRVNTDKSVSTYLQCIALYAACQPLCQWMCLFCVFFTCFLPFVF